MTIEQFTKATLRASPWKNGSGVTREIVAYPLGADMEHFAWRVSIAELSTSSAFSQFSGVDRLLVLLDGEGVVLKSDNGGVVHRLDTPLTPFAFAGETSLTASLLGGPSTDFNVMTRRTRASAKLRVVRGPEVEPSASAGVLFAARGSWLVKPHLQSELENANAYAQRLATGAGLWWAGELLAWQVHPDPVSEISPVLLAVGIHSR